MTIVGAAWGIGYIVGPAMSGALADPIGQYNITSKYTTAWGNVHAITLYFFPYSSRTPDQVPILSAINCQLPAVHGEPSGDGPLSP